MEKYDGEDLSGYDLAVRSPSVPPYKIVGARQVTSVTREFMERCPAVVVGVTGTKGKGTTASFVASILEAAGRRTHLLGNIGEPALDALDEVRADDVVVYEMSSYQLWDVEKSPHVAVIVPIEEAHLDVHRDMADYVGAKANIVKHQGANDVVIYDRTNRLATEVASRSAGEKIGYPTEGFDYEVGLLGAHNLRNAEAAVRAVEVLGVTDRAVIQKGIADFKGLPHRLALVREVDGVEYVNDSISTTLTSLRAAILESFDKPLVLIVGGVDQGMGMEAELAKVMDNPKVKMVLLIGQTGPKIAAELEKLGKAHEVVGTMGAAVTRAREVAESGDVVLLSPSAPSFDMFKNYVERGEKFMELVNSW
ncbi:UDP-N-acetylmuramoyl-L-alanine--D-glutamate ligase [Candidatus Saccharibacteria bacterium]|nr:UDP-N-acetylmuramoyl-L-alanine--D-glutamate ligase [Candidatus Saccharibacteria bacterium]